MEREITLRDYGRVLWQGRWLILATTLLAGLIGLLLSFGKQTTYTSTASDFMGQATSQSGVPVVTLRTNPATAAQGLKSDDLIQKVAGATGISADRVRDDVTLSAARTAGNGNVNQPTIVSVSVTDRERPVARRVTEAYAAEVFRVANDSYAPQIETYMARIKNLVVRENNLISEAKSYRAQLARATGERGTFLLSNLNNIAGEMALVRNDIDQQQLDLQKSKQIEAPALVSGASTAKSSGGAKSRLSSAIFAAIIGAILGIIATLVWKGGPADRRPADAT